MKKRLSALTFISLVVIGVFVFSFVLADYNYNPGSTNTAAVNSTQNNTDSTSSNNTSSNMNGVPPVDHENQQNNLPPTAAAPNRGLNQNSNAAVWANSYSPDLIQELQCRINFNIGVLNLLSSTFPDSSSQIQPSINSLQNDLNQVQGMSNSSAIIGFGRGQYTSDINSALHATELIGKGRGKNLTIEQRASLVSSYNQLQQTMSQCQQQSYSGLIQQRIQNYQEQIADFQNKTNELSSRGFDVTTLNQLLSDAQTQIIQPLQQASSSVNNTQDIQNAVRSYCLYDGCTNGTNFHLDAKFNVDRAQTIFASLQNNSAAFNLSSSDLSQVQRYISDAQSVLESVGTSSYQNGQSQQIFSDIKSATQIIVQMITKTFDELPRGAR